MKAIMLLALASLSMLYGFAQNNLCNGAGPICTDLTHTFPANVNTASAQAGPNYMCLVSQPNPTWYYLLVDQPGNIALEIQTVPQHDIDFICWGPFADPTGSCTSELSGVGTPGTHHNAGPGGGYPAENTVDCSYDPSYQEWCYIPNAQTGQYYIIMFTNYSNQQHNIVLNQLNAGQPGAGSLNCNIVNCNFDNITYTVNPCNPLTNQFSLTGNLLFHFDGSPVTTGTLTIVDQPSGISQTFNPPFTSNQAFTLDNILSDGSTHTITAIFSDAPNCSYSITYNAPPPCNSCFANAGSNITVCGITATTSAIEYTGDVNTHWVNNYPSIISFGNINNPVTTVTTTTPGTYNLIWQVTNNSGLTCFDTISATFKTIPTASFVVNSPVCVGQTSTATYTGTGGSNFIWNFGTGVPETAYTAGPHTITYNTSGNLPVTLSVIASNGCQSDIVTNTVVVNPLPLSDFTAQSPICAGDPSSVVYTGVGGSIFAWNFNGATILSGTIPSPGPYSVTWNTAGTYALTLQVQSTQGCNSTATTQYVQVLPIATPNCCLTPSPNAGPDNNVCGTTFILSGTIPAPGNIGTWTTISGPGTATFEDNTANNSSVTVSVPGTYVFQWYESSGVCNSSDQVTVIFTTQPVANAGLKSQICGLDMQLDATPSIGVGTWTVCAPMAATFTPNSSTYNATVHAMTGYGDYYLIWTEVNGACISRDTVWKTFLQVPIISAGMDATGCGQTVVLSADSIYPGYWTAVPPTAIYTPNANDPNASVWIPSYTGATYNVTFTWHAVNGICPGSDNVIITFMKPPHAEAGASQSVCGTTAQLMADTIGSGITSAYWTSSIPGIPITQIGGTSIPFNVSVDISAVPDLWVNSQLAVYFYWIAQNSSGCTSIDSVLVTFYEIPIADAGLDSSVCGKFFDLGGNWSIDNFSGIWSTQLPAPGVANFIPTNTPNGEVTVTQFGVYNFIWKEMNAGNITCFDRDTVTINFLTVPMPDAGLDFSVCGNFAYICATPSVASGQWSCPSGGVAYYDAENGNITPANQNVPCTWIRYMSENDTITMFWSEFNGVCSGYDSVNVFFGAIQPAVHLVDPADSVVCGLTYTLLNAQDPAYGYGYWIDPLFNTTFSPSNIDPSPTVTILPTDYGYHYYYWITVNGNCRDTSEAVPVRFIENPVANAGGHYWAGLFGPNSHIKTDTVCGLNYEMGAVPTIGDGLWYTQHTLSIFDSTNVNSTPDPTDSLYLNCLNACCSVFAQTGPQYYQYIWQENHENCISSDTLRLYFAPYPSGQFSFEAPACPQNNYTIVAHTWPLPNDVDYGLTTFEWNYPNGILDPSITSPSTSDTIFVQWTTGHQHDVDLITRNIWGCISGVVSQTLTEPSSGYITGQISSSPSIDYSAFEINVFRSETNAVAPLVETIPLSSTGNFDFEVPGSGDFYVEARLINPNSGIPYINSYYNNAYEWANAQTVSLTCQDSVNINIPLFGYTPATGGNCRIYGLVRYDVSLHPVPNVMVYIRYQPNQDPARFEYTNSNGYYSINNIATGNYKLFVDIPGLPQVTNHHIVVNPNDTVFANVNFIVDTTAIHKDYGFGIYADTTGYNIHVTLTDFTSDNINAFPNPFTEYISISGTLKYQENISVELIDNSGQTIKNYPDNYFAPGEFNFRLPVPALTKGVYYLKITINNTVYIKKLTRL